MFHSTIVREFLFIEYLFGHK